MKNKLSAVCFGETLWDVFPGSREPGGAPMNAAVHLAQHGTAVQMISRVGDDDDGRKLITLMTERGVDTAHVQQDAAIATGTVSVITGSKVENSYDIVFPSAWDFISPTAGTKAAVRSADLFIYGSLASRHQVSESALLELLPDANLRVMDLNLRSPHYRLENLPHLIKAADILKMNEDEMLVLSQWLDIAPAGAERFCRELQERFPLKQIMVTRAERGAVLYDGNNCYTHPGCRVKVVNTVGSGDAFLAAYLSKWWKGWPPPDALAYACAAGALTATSRGANPVYSEEDIKSLL